MPAGATVRIEDLTGSAILPALADVARLRIEVFREWPYLYDGSLDYEREYLAGFSKARDALIVAAWDGARIIGAATAAPLADHTSMFAPLFRAQGLDPERIFYCGESVLLPSYRGSGLGHAFFDRREAHARRCTGPTGAFTHVAFCAVVRVDEDPRKPLGYRPLDVFWSKRGYRQVAGLVGNYAWQEIGARIETEKPMQFWMKPL